MSRTGRGEEKQIKGEVEAKVRDDGYKYVVVSAHDATAVAAAGAQTVNLGLIPYKRWRVVAFGFIVSTLAASTKTEETDFGLLLADVGDADADNIGRVQMCAVGGDQYVAGDMVMKVYEEQGKYGTTGLRTLAVDYGLQTPDVVENAVPPGIQVGVEFGKWQTKMAYIQVTNTGMTGSTAQMIPFVVLEVGHLNLAEI